MSPYCGCFDRANWNSRILYSSRYRATELEKIDFDGLKKEIESRQHSIYALYTYMRKSEVLNKINEALAFGFSSLKDHLLLMVNLYLDDLRS